ncbi:hypothetical protein R1T08_09760 [Streptomyces sp. SBC-4]|nr:hypothetical protein [Streptomyces sp. SBC-4]MDV5144512.1 hypothetical protein [Streptomyces sp. SBC-4]
MRDRVAEQELASDDRLEALIREGVARGEFRTDDPRTAAIQILVVLDGLGAHANTDRSNRPEAVTRMAVTTAERELGLAHGALTDVPPLTEPAAEPASSVTPVEPDEPDEPVQPDELDEPTAPAPPH